MVRRLVVCVMLGAVVAVVGGCALLRSPWVSSVVGPAEVLAEQRAVAEASSGDVYAVTVIACDEVRRASGFLVGGLVVTNAHVAGGAEHLNVVGPGLLGTAEVSRVATGVDLAVAPLGLTGGLTWADADPEVGERVVVVGRGAGSFAWRPATVELYGDSAAYGGLGPALLLDASTEPGFSGGAVLNLDGEVLGVLRAVDTATGLAVAEPMSTYRDWLARDKYGDEKTSC